MPVLVYLPAPLRSRADGRRQIEVSAHSLRILLDEMEAAYPGITGRLRQDDGSLRHGLSIYVNGDNVRFLQGLDTRLQDGDEVSIVPAVAGGGMSRRVDWERAEAGAEVRRHHRGRFRSGGQ